MVGVVHKQGDKRLPHLIEGSRPGEPILEILHVSLDVAYEGSLQHPLEAVEVVGKGPQGAARLIGNPPVGGSCNPVLDDDSLGGLDDVILARAVSLRPGHTADPNFFSGWRARSIIAQ